MRMGITINLDRKKKVETEKRSNFQNPAEWLKQALTGGLSGGGLKV